MIRIIICLSLSIVGFYLIVQSTNLAFRYAAEKGALPPSTFDLIISNVAFDYRLGGGILLTVSLFFLLKSLTEKETRD